MFSHLLDSTNAHYSRLGSAHLVIIGGLAELFSGAISMGLGAYLASVTERDHYIAEEKRERNEVATKPEAERAEIYDILAEYEIGTEACTAFADALERNPDNWVRVRNRAIANECLLLEILTNRQFMMNFELKLEKPNVSRAWISAATMGLSYFIGKKRVESL